MRIAALLIGASLLASCSKSDSAHMKRAKEVVSVGEWSTAKTELKLELKDHPEDAVARGMLLYTLYRSDDLPKSAGANLAEVNELLAITREPDFADASQETRDLLTKMMVELRQGLYDKGVDTKDDSDLAAVLLESAKFGYAVDDDKARKDMSAAILARSGDADALAYLIDRLKTKNAERIVEYVVAAGDAAVKPLQLVIADKGFIGRDSALRALVDLEAATAARAMLRDNKNLRSLVAQKDVPGTDQLGNNMLTDVDLVLDRVHGRYTTLDQGADGFLILQSWDDAAKHVAVQMYAFRDGALSQVRATQSGKPFDVVGTTPFFDLRAAAGVVSLARIEQRSVVHQVAHPVTLPTVGMTVRVHGYTPVGHVMRADEAGLWIVHVDTPIEGLTDLTVQPSQLSELRDETQVETTSSRYSGKLSTDTIDFVIGNDVMAKMSQFKDEMCACADRKDSECAKRVTDEMSKWAVENAGKADTTAKPTEQETRIGQQLAECTTKAMMAGYQ